MAFNDWLVDENGEPIDDFADISYADILKEEPKSKWQKVGNVLQAIGRAGLTFDAARGNQGSQSVLGMMNRQDEAEENRKTNRQNLLLKMKQSDEDKRYKAEQNRISRESNPYLMARTMTVEQNTHNQNVNKLKSDSTLNKLSQAQNRLANGLAITSEMLGRGLPVTVQQLNDLQQGVALAATGGGQTIGAEREARYLSSIQMKLKDLMTKATNNPQGINANDPLLKQIIAEANGVNQSIFNIAKKRVDSLKEGHESLYKRRPDFSQDLDSLVANLIKQFDTGQEQGQQLPNIGKPKQIQQNGHLYILNEATGEYE